MRRKARAKRESLSKAIRERISPFSKVKAELESILRPIPMSPEGVNGVAKKMCPL